MPRHGPKRSRPSQVDAVQDTARLKELLARGQGKAALDLAKRLHHGDAGEETRRLLVDAYELRLNEFAQRGMLVEASALLHVVEERFPDAMPRFRDLQAELLLRSGNVAAVVSPLTGAEVAETVRRDVEEALRRFLRAPGDLAACPALPADHPLRVAAEAVARAFEAVTSGPVEESLLELPEVSRRSPLAPWKQLIRAIAALHQGFGKTAVRAVEAIPEDTVPGRLRPLLAQLAAVEDVAQPGSPAAKALCTALLPVGGTLKDDVGALDAMLRDGGADPNRLCPRVRRVLAHCRQVAPGVLEELSERIFALLVMADLDGPAALEAAGPSLRPRASFWRLLALAQRRMLGENDFVAYEIPSAVLCWDLFRRTGIAEGLLDSDTPAEGAVLWEMARDAVSLLDSGFVDSDRDANTEILLADMEDAWADFPLVKAARVAGADLPLPVLADPAALFAKAAALLPEPLLFREWLEFADGTDAVTKRRKAREAALTAWVEARPQDQLPRLLLVQAARERGARRQALDLIAKAERLAPLSQAMNQEKSAILVDAILDHCRRGNANPVDRDIEQLAAIPAFSDGMGAMLVACLRTIRSVAFDPPATIREGRRRRQALADAMGTLAGAVVLLRAVAISGDVPLAPGIAEATDKEVEGESIAAGLALAINVCALAGRQPWLPQEWVKRASQELHRTGARGVDERCLLRLAEATLDDDDLYHANSFCSMGLARRGAATARFLAVRAACLPHGSRRRTLCIVACTELGRRQRDETLAQRLGSIDSDGTAKRYAQDEALSDAHLQAIIAFEVGAVSISVERMPPELAALADRYRQPEFFGLPPFGDRPLGFPPEDEEDNHSPYPAVDPEDLRRLLAHFRDLMDTGRIDSATLHAAVQDLLTQDVSDPDSRDGLVPGPGRDLINLLNAAFDDDVEDESGEDWYGEDEDGGQGASWDDGRGDPTARPAHDLDDWTAKFADSLDDLCLMPPAELRFIEDHVAHSPWQALRGAVPGIPAVAGKQETQDLRDLLLRWMGEVKRARESHQRVDARRAEYAMEAAAILKRIWACPDEAARTAPGSAPARRPKARPKKRGRRRR